MNADKLELLTLAQLPDREQVQRLAERVFGSGDRPRGWFARKLQRECIDNDMSFVAADTRGVPLQTACEDPQGWYGMVLVNAPPSRPGMAHCVTLGVLRHLQGRGVGARLMDAAVTQARRAGLRRMQALVEPALVAYYQSLGFTSQRVVRTMLAFGRGSTGATTNGGPERASPEYQASGPTPAASQGLGDTASPETDARGLGNGVDSAKGEPWSPDDLVHHVELCGWLAEAWERTPPDDRLTLRGPLWCAHTSREGKSRLVHRLLVARDVDRAKVQVTATEELLDAVAAGEPVLMYGCDAKLAQSLSTRGWATVQTGTEVERDL
ncbi:MAG: GNAT family N-acetyltransferase [Myxococcales bacterium FL481]|nr:MAG: GNAT family N-acetyltransferase [Myxococcales bacterium FL481]